MVHSQGCNHQHEEEREREMFSWRRAVNNEFMITGDKNDASEKERERGKGLKIL